MTIRAKTSATRVLKTKKASPGYLHGFSSAEQDRLYGQAQFLAPMLYANIDFSKQSNLLEVGCGVGAQTAILLERFGHLRISGVDGSDKQLARARKYLAKPIKAGRVTLTQADALSLPFAENQFDSAFVCWFLEHVQKPVEILAEVRRVLATSAVIYCNEVLNATFYVHPYSPATLQYWFAFNDHQWNLGGDPFVGAKLANYLLSAGFQNVSTHVIVNHYDDRAPKQRAQFIEFWTRLLLSGADNLLVAGRVTPELVHEMTQELGRLRDDPQAVFFYSWLQARAQAF